MKKKLIEAIKAKFVGIDEATAGRLASRAIGKGEPITTDDEVVAAVDAITLADVLKSVEDFSSNEATKRYETKYNLKDGKPVAAPEPKQEEQKQEPQAPTVLRTAPDSKGDDARLEGLIAAAVGKAVKDLAGKIDTLGGDIAAIKKGRVAESRKSRLAEAIKDLKEVQKRAYGRIALDSMNDDEFDTFLGEIKEEVNELVADNRAAGAVVQAPLGGSHVLPSGKGEATQEEIDAVVDKLL